VLPLLQQLAGKSMRQRHWDEIQSITGKTLDMDATVLKLGHMLEMNLLAHAEEVEDICTASSKELQIETKLRATVADWEETNFGKLSSIKKLIVLP
jgi:dynein heavy chain